MTENAGDVIDEMPAGTGCDMPPGRDPEPHAIRDGARDYLVVFGTVDYPIADDPIKAIGLIYHLSEKSWATRRCLRRIIAEIARVKGWSIAV